MTATSSTASTTPTSGAGADLPPRAQRRAVLSSLGAGLGLAGLSTLVLLPGAREHVTSGSALLSFGAGFAVLDLATRRRGSHVQSWARVPAAAMALTGLALLVFSPGDAALDRVGWVWPPALLGLALWTARQVRRSLHARGAWLLYPVVALLALAALGGLAQTLTGRSDGRDLAMPGRLYDVGDHRLHLNCSGTGRPTVVLENGLGGSSPQWDRVMRTVRATTRVCSYDRAGQGWSDEVSGPRDSLAVVRDLRTLLRVAGERGPYLLAAHSAGGAYVMTYAAHHPSEVAGLVLVDSVSPRQFTVLPDYPRQEALLRRLYGVAPTLARMGVGRALNLGLGSDLEGSARTAANAFAASPRSWRTVRDENAAFRAAFQQAAELTDLGDKPLVVVSSRDNLRSQRGWREAQAELAALSSNRSQREIATSHTGLLEEPTAALGTAGAITDAVWSLRLRNGLDQP